MLDYGDDWRWIDDLTLTLPRPLALLLVLFVIVCVVAVTGAWGQAPEQPQGGVTFNCGQLARAIGAVATYRDADASEEKTIAMYRAINPQIRGPQWDVLEREMRRLWRERLPAEEAAWGLFMRCQQQLGDMGREG